RLRGKSCLEPGMVPGDVGRRCEASPESTCQCGILGPRPICAWFRAGRSGRCEASAGECGVKDQVSRANLTDRTNDSTLDGKEWWRRWTSPSAVSMATSPG